VKKLLAGLLIGGLFSLGCGDTGTTPKDKKTGTPTNVKKPMEDKDEGTKPKDEGKPEAKPETKPETKPEIKPKDDAKKPDKKDAK
jgi:hypothetical protein